MTSTESFGTWGAPDYFGMIHFPAEITSLKPFAKGINFSHLQTSGVQDKVVIRDGEMHKSLGDSSVAFGFVGQRNRGKSCSVSQKQMHKAMN